MDDVKVFIEPSPRVGDLVRRSMSAMEGGDDRNGEWARIRAKLRAEFGEPTYRNWLGQMTLVAVEDGKARIALPTRFLRDWVVQHYVDRLRVLWKTENPAVKDVEVVLAAGAEPPKPAPRDTRAAPDKAEDVAEDVKDGSALLDPRFTFENFIVGKPNELAHAAARRVAEAACARSRKLPYNPLFLYGGVGLGKTHLMHAIAWYIRRQEPQRKVIYVSAEKFMNQFIRALRFKDTMAFKEQFRTVDVLMVDDVQFISGKDSTQEEFFHTFNALVDLNRQIVISADKSPSDLEMEERLKSRLGWGLVADLHPTTYELRLSILQSKAEQMQLDVPQRVMEFVAHRLVANVRQLEGALNRIYAHTHLVGRPITLDEVHDALHDLLRANDRRVSIDEIQKRVAEHYNIRLADMHSARRARAVARPRQVAMYLCKQLTPRSLPEIGRKFGGRDHTTVIHAVKKIEELRQTDRAIAEDVELLRRMLET